MLIKRLKNPMTCWFIAGSVFAAGGFVRAEKNPGFFLNAKTYLHTPEVFADRWLGILEPNPQIPMNVRMGELWYLRYEGRLDFVSLPAVVKLVKERHIPGLDLSGQRDIMDADMKPLGDLIDLRYLSLTGTRVSDHGLYSLLPLVQMRVLTLDDQITDDGLKFLQRMTGLNELNLSGAQITDKGLEALHGFLQLERLDLSDTPVTDKGLRSLTALKLRQLRLGAGISDAGLKTLSAIRTLVQLDLKQTRVTDQGLKALSAFPALHTLFTNRRVSDAGLSEIVKRRTLRRLDLTAAAISDAGVGQLAKLSGLEELSLAQTSVSDKSIGALAGLPHLRYLEISDSSVTLHGIEQLVGMKRLEVLSFSYPGDLKLGDLKPLARISALNLIIVNGRSLPYEAMRYLRNQIPKSGWERFFDRWMPELDAADQPPDIPLSDNTDVAQLTQRKGVSAIQVAGLPRIHSVESQLDEIIPAPSTIGQDNQQDTETNFLGEFSVGVGSKKKSK